MSTDNSPTFPLPSTPMQYDAATQAGQHIPGQHPGPAQGHFYPPPQVRSSRSDSGYTSSNVPPPRPPPHIRGNSGYQPIQGPVRNQTQTFQMPQVPETGVPATTYGPPPPMAHSRGETIQMPDYRNNTTHLAPGPYSNYSPQPQAMSHSTSSGMMLGPAYNAPHDQSDPRYQRGSVDDRIRDDRVPPSIQCTNSGMSSKGPPSGGTSGITGRAGPPPKPKMCGLC